MGASLMKLKGKTILMRATGKELGIVTKVSKDHVWIEHRKFPKDVVVSVKKYKKARKGKAPSEKTLNKQQRRDDHKIQLSQDLLLEIPEFLRQQEPVDTNTQHHIQLKSYGCNRGSKMWHTSSRSFPDVVQAQRYLEQLIGGEKIDYGHDERKRSARLYPSNRGINCNYRFDYILKGKAPKGLLPNIILGDDKKIRNPRLSPTPPTQTRSITMAKKTGDNMVLKQLCRDLDLDPRKARIKLRKTVGNTTGRWEWEKGSKELKEVTDILTGNNSLHLNEVKVKKKKTKKNRK
jgi:hypothetical protein